MLIVNCHHTLYVVQLVDEAAAHSLDSEGNLIPAIFNELGILFCTLDLQGCPRTLHMHLLPLDSNHHHPMEESLFQMA
jgi:hypothetical protein